MFHISKNITLFLHGLMLYLFIFIIPIAYYLKLKAKTPILDFFKLNNHPLKGCIKGLIISSIFVIILIIKNIFLGCKPINFNLGILWISGSLVGFLEEIPFRGFLLEKLSTGMNFWAANLLTTLLFVIVHIPIWTINNANLPHTIESAAIFSLVLGYLFKEYDSLWVPIICHSVFNLCIWMGLT